MTALSPLDATLVDELRVLPGFSRNRDRVSPAESTLTDFAPVTPLSATLTENTGRGRAMPTDNLLLNLKGLPHTEAALRWQR